MSRPLPASESAVAPEPARPMGNGESFVVPASYKPALGLRETQVAIKQLKDFFEVALAGALNLARVSAPLFVQAGTGLNDDLNGVERPVAFKMDGDGRADIQMVQSLAKWKRYALARYGFGPGEGLYTDMNAVRKDERPDNLHSIYVDQWDWERVITRPERNLEILKATIRRIYDVFRGTQALMARVHPGLFDAKLPPEIFFLTTQELEDLYPGLDPKDREDRIAVEKKAVGLLQIGGRLRSGQPHDGRAPDYDDWDLNADIIFWYPVLDRAFEVSSMGIRVDEEALLRQLKVAGCEDRAKLTFHRMLLDGQLPYTIGGGIGQSRLCMFFLEKAHIGEVQASVWPDDMVVEAARAGIPLL